MTVLRLVRLRSPSDFADWFRLGAEYVRDVTDGMGFEVASPPAGPGEGGDGSPTAATGSNAGPTEGAGETRDPDRDLDALVAAGVDAMRAGRTTDVDPRVARLIAADLLADAAFADPFCQWTPLWYELALAAPNALAERRLRAVARTYARAIGDETGTDGASTDPDAIAPEPSARAPASASGAGAGTAGRVPSEVAVPRFTRPRDVLVDGASPVAGLGADARGFARRFVLADALLHVEWYVHVAREAGVVVPRSLVARARRETLAYWTGRTTVEDLSPDVRRFQALLFADDAWVRGIDEAYDLDSRLLDVWERLCRREREALEAGRQSPVWS